MAVTYDKTKTGALLGVTPHASPAKAFVMKNTVDLTGVIPIATDIYQCLAIPAGVKVVEVAVKIITPATGTSGTFSVGDGASAAGWYANTADCKAAAGTYYISANGTDARAVATTNGYLYEAADSIDVTIAATGPLTAGPKFSIMAWCVDYR